MSLTPLLIVAVLAWEPSTGRAGLVALLCNEALLAVALTLGGAAAAGLLTRSAGAVRPLKLLIGGLTFLATVACVALYVIVKVHAGHLSPDQMIALITGCSVFAISGALACEILSEV